MTGMQRNKKGLLVVLSAASGTGKNTVAEIVLASNRRMKRSISVTTRPPRNGESDGHSYHFVSDKEFDAILKRGDFLEWAKVHSHRYGTPASFVKESTSAGSDVLLIIDVQGGRAVKSIYPEAVLIFLAPPSAGELKRRLFARGSENPREAAVRLNNAAGELLWGTGYDYIVVNDKIEDAAESITAILEAEKCSAARMRLLLERLHEETSKLALDNL
jgi:guanylate kinase